MAVKFNLRWLAEFCEFSDKNELARHLTAIGLEVDTVEPWLARQPTGVVVAKIIEINPHPNAERLRLLVLDSGNDTHNIVCGDLKLQIGDIVPLALVGAKIGDGIKIKKSKIRGEESHGMACSASELSLGFGGSDGVMCLPGATILGQNIVDALELDDDIITLELTPNRADCFSVFGIARDYNQTKGNEVVEPFVEDHALGDGESAKLIGDCNKNLVSCVRLQQIEIDNTVPSPLWITQRLAAAGMRSINLLIDVLNYVMLELGQPLHAYDSARVAGEICFQEAVPGQEISLLDDVQLTTQGGELVAQTNNGVNLGLAGLLGGAGCAITDQTTTAVLEAAHFYPLPIRKMAQAHNLSSESGIRFERGVDPYLGSRALNRVITILRSCNASLKVYNRQSWGAAANANPEIVFSSEKLNAVLGSDIEHERIVKILADLGCIITEKGEDLLVRGPSYRYDINIDVDLIEEVARVVGYESVGKGQFVGRGGEDLQWHSQVQRVALERLVGYGYNQVITYSFIDPALQDAIYRESDLLDQQVKVINPIAANMAVMRLSLLPSLVKVAVHQLNNGRDWVRICELGSCYRYSKESDNCTDERVVLGGLVLGRGQPKSWNIPDVEVDFYSVKAEIMALSDGLVAGGLAVKEAAVPGLHRGRSADLLINGEVCGWIGELCPRLQVLWKLPRCYVFQIDVGFLSLADKKNIFQPINRQPFAIRDVSFMMGDGLSYEKIKDFVVKRSKDCLHSVELFDIYRGSDLRYGEYSIAIRLVWQMPSLDEGFAVDAAFEEIIKAVEDEFDVKVRGK